MNKYYNNYNADNISHNLISYHLNNINKNKTRNPNHTLLLVIISLTSLLSSFLSFSLSSDFSF